MAELVKPAAGGGLWVPRGARLSFRDRVAPASGGVRVEGWATHELINERTGRVEKTLEQHNLILDQGLGLMRSGGIFSVQAYAVVGDGASSATAAAVPAVTDTTLANERARTNANGGTADPGAARVANGTYRQKVQREFSAASVANMNLTEWGFSPSSGALTNLAVRELFKDGGGNPVVITPDGTQKLRITYELEAQLGPVVPTVFNCNITNFGVFSGQYVLSQSADLETLQYLLQGVDKYGSYDYAAESYVWKDSDAGKPAALDYTTTTAGGNNATRYQTTKTYSAIANGRAASYFYDTGTCNDSPFRWIQIGRAAGNNTRGSMYPGVWFNVDAGVSLSKTNLQSLTLDLLSVTLGRA